MYLCSAFGKFLSAFDVPYLALPFNMIAVCVMLTIKPMETFSAGGAGECESGNFTEWEMLGRGVLVSMSQVYAVNDVTTSIMMYIAALIASPLLFVTSVLGGLVGSAMGN